MGSNLRWLTKKILEAIVFQGFFVFQFLLPTMGKAENVKIHKGKTLQSQNDYNAQRGLGNERDTVRCLGK